MPKVSVLLPVRDGEAYIRDALDSMLAQTFRDIEIVVMDDGSQDNTVQILETYRDSRVRIFRNAQPLGLSKNLNLGISRVTGEFVARMDHDDISLPRRLEKQVAQLEANPGIDLVGTWARTKGLASEQFWFYPTSHDEICSEMLFNSPLVHSAVMWRSAKFSQVGLRYAEDVERAQDYELWARAAAAGVTFANLPQVLLLYRIHEQQVGSQFGLQQGMVADRVRKGQVEKLGIQPSEAELETHLDAARWMFPKNLGGLRFLEVWLLKLKRANVETKAYEAKALAKTLENRWWAACRSNVRLGNEVWNLYRKSPLADSYRPIGDKAVFFTKAQIYARIGRGSTS